MKKIISLIILLLLPIIVFAKDCDLSKITITSIEQTSIVGDTEVISEPSIDGKKIYLNLKMYEVGDSISYDLVINNDSDEDYMIDEDTFKSDSEYIEYVLTTEDNSNVVKAKSSKNMTLIVTYKNEVSNSLLTNNKFNASNMLKLSMNTQEKVKELEELSTNPIAQEPIIKEVKNPLTSTIGFNFLVVMILMTISIILLTVINKKQYNKYIIIIGIIYLIPTIYAACVCDIEVEATIEIEKIPKLFDTIVGLASNENACVTKYEGEVTDQVGETVNANNVYFDKCADKRNVIFNNMCWQVIRTTEKSGTKIIYNGDAVDGKCESTRGEHKGIVQSNSYIQLMSSNYLYGSSFTYDTETNTFTLVDTENAIWSDSTYENLLGKFTCKSTEGTCETLYSVNGYYDNIGGYASFYTIADTNYAQIGTSSYNANSTSPAMMGYMFNKSYRFNSKAPGTNTYKYSNTFTYDSSSGTYTLSGTINEISDWATEYNTINNTHYTCWNIDGSCNTISYIFSTSTNYAYHINITDGKGVSDALNEMLFNDNVNRYNSSIKGIIDNWYRENLLNKTNMLEDTVYCNARIITQYGGFDPNGGDTYNSFSLTFKNYDETTNLECPNETDQFAVSNNKAKLAYPVGLLQVEERNIINTPSLMASGSYWWSSSPVYFVGDVSFLNSISAYGNRSTTKSNRDEGVRPAVSLKASSKIVSGDGSEESPWVIKE